MSDATPLADVSAKLPRRFRRLRIAVSVFFGALTVALCVFWVRSYRFRDEMNYRYWPSRVFEIVSMESRLEFVNGDPISDWPHRFNSHANGEWDSYRMSHPRGFSGGNTVGTPFRVTIPHYAVIIMQLSLLHFGSIEFHAASPSARCSS